MNKPFKVLSSVALASVMSVSALTPVAAAENTQEQINVQEFIFENHEGYTVKVSLDMYNAAFDLGAIDTKNNKFVKGTDNQYYSIDKYNAAFDIAGTPEGAMKILAEKNQHEIDVEEDKIYSAEFNKDTKQFDAIIDDQPEDRLNETFFYNFAA